MAGVDRRESQREITGVETEATLRGNERQGSSYKPKTPGVPLKLGEARKVRPRVSGGTIALPTHRC